MSEGVFLSALQPNSSTVTTYALPGESELPHGGAYSSDATRSKRVQQQVAQRLMEKSTLPRRNNTSSSSSTQYATISNSAQYPTSEYGGSSTMMKYQTINPTFSSKSYVSSSNTARPVMAHHPSQHVSSGYSSRSAMDYGTRSQISRGAAGGIMYNNDDMGVIAGMGTMAGGYQGGQSQKYQMTTTMRSMSRGVPDADVASLHSLRMQSLPQQHVNTWITRNGSEGSLASDQDTTFIRQDGGYNISNGYATTYSVPLTNMANEYSSVARQTSATLPMRRSVSGTLARNGGYGVSMEDEGFVRQSFKGPSQRTISRITQSRQNRSSMSAGSIQGGGSTGGFLVGGVQGRMSRAPSMRSMISVGRGKDVYDGMDTTGSMGNLSALNSLDMLTAVKYLSSSNMEDQTVGAAYIQHECYSSIEAKKQVNKLNGIPPLVNLFTSEAQRVQQYATGAARNLIYEDMENKMVLIKAGGITKLMEALKDQDDELQKNITGILWNLSSKDSLKQTVAAGSLEKLTEQILGPLTVSGDEIFHSDSENEIFCNATGCLRNLSSSSETRKLMRNNAGLIDTLVRYLKAAVKDERVENKGVENIVCVMRNLSYQLYDELPSTTLVRLEGHSRDQSSSKAEPIGCFSPRTKKSKDRQNQDLSTFSEVSRVPKGSEWLWHPNVLKLYKNVLSGCKTNAVSREAAAGALQNLTAGERRWAGVLSRFALERESMLPILKEKLQTDNTLEQRSVAGFLRNLSRHCKDKDLLAKELVPCLVDKLPESNTNTVSPDVLIHICGALNNLVSSSEGAARKIVDCHGLEKLMSIKNNHNYDPKKQQEARAASTVLCNMFQYRKLHKAFTERGFSKNQFLD